MVLNNFVGSRSRHSSSASNANNNHPKGSNGNRPQLLDLAASAAARAVSVSREWAQGYFEPLCEVVASPKTLSKHVVKMAAKVAVDTQRMVTLVGAWVRCWLGWLYGCGAGYRV